MRFPDEFFPAAVDMLRGKISAEEMARRLGPCSSGIERLGYYRTLMVRNVELILGSLFPAFRHWIGDQPGHFSRLAQQYEALHPPEHFEPNAFGRFFPEFVERLCARGELHAAAADLVDYEWVRYAVGIVERIEEPFDVLPSASNLGKLGTSPSPAVRAIVRHYEHDVPTYAAAVWRSVPPVPLTPRPTAVLVYRRSDGHSAVLRPTFADLIALGKACGRVDALHEARASQREVEEAHNRLISLGILAKSIDGEGLKA